MVEYRFYEMPQGLPALALTGEGWEIVYGADEMHFHNHLEIGICYYGEGNIVLEGQRLPYHAGTITFIPPNIPHHTEPVPEEMEKIQKWEYLFLDAKSIVEEVFPGGPQKKEFMKCISEQVYVLGEENEAIGLAQMIIKEMDRKKEHYKYAVKKLSFYLLLFFMRLGYSEGRQEQINRSNVHYVNTVIQYMEECYMHELGPEDLAKSCGLSESYIRKLFLEYVNETPMGYLRLLRIDKSCDLLAKTDKSIELIAEEVGIPAVSTFMRNFKKITGISPAKWRKEAWKRPENIRHYHVPVLKGWQW